MRGGQESTNKRGQEDMREVDVEGNCSAEIS